MSGLKVGVFGLGKMGKGLVLQMKDRGYDVVAYNRSPGPREEVRGEGVKVADSLSDLVGELEKPKIVWLMLPSGGVTDNAMAQLTGMLGKGDIVIDGANGKYTEDVKHNGMLKARGIEFIDAGCSGGPSGARNGMCIMAGGSMDAIKQVEKMFKDLSVKDGYLYVGEAGSGHFVKMVHNAIEYGMMQSIAEGLDLVANGPYKGLDLTAICRLWNNGSVVRGYLIELAERALSKDARLESVSPYVDDTGEGRYSIETALEYSIPFTVISHSLFERYASRSEYRFGDRMLAALRHEFGGHAVREGKAGSGKVKKG